MMRIRLNTAKSTETMATLSLCSAFTRRLSADHSPKLSPTSLSPNPSLSFSLSNSLSRLTLNSPRRREDAALSFVVKSSEAEAEAASETASEAQVEEESSETDGEKVAETEKPKREEVFAVVMVGSRQYIVHPGRYIYTQRLKGANVNDKITLNKVLLVGTKTSAYIGRPIVPNAVVQAVVEEQTLDKKVVVFKYKKKKNYRRNIGHRQPITRIRITSITGYQDSPVATLP